MFSPSELAELRQMSLDAMDAEAVVMRPNAAPVYGQGGGAPTEVARARCRVVESGSGNEQTGAAGQASVSPYLLQLDGVHVVQGKDFVEVTWDAGGSQRYEVTAAETPVSYQVNTRLFCTRAT